ncbi:MAG: hypothetical protein K2I96_21875 [Lachnospiraceae bacterium]|nr:hypothetical protein [Lachnospiraceae bacterium]
MEFEGIILFVAITTCNPGGDVREWTMLALRFLVGRNTGGSGTLLWEVHV